jgi:hypothetical protein
VLTMGWQAVVLHGTLGRVKRRADLMERQNIVSLASSEAAKANADAALLSATAIVNSERSWVFAAVTAWEFVEEDAGDEILHRVKVIISLENFGRSPAFIGKAQCGASFKGFNTLLDESIFASFMDEYQRGYVERLPLPPGKATKAIEATSPDTLSESEWDRFKSLAYWPPPIVYGVIHYSDPHGQDRVTKFCFGRWREGAVVIGLPSVNRHWVVLLGLLERLPLVLHYPYRPVPALLSVRSAWKARSRAPGQKILLLLYGFHSHLAKVPILVGQLKYYRDRHFGKQAKQIEYKEGASA